MSRRHALLVALALSPSLFLLGRSLSTSELVHPSASTERATELTDEELLGIANKYAWEYTYRSSKANPPLIRCTVPDGAIEEVVSLWLLRHPVADIPKALLHPTGAAPSDAEAVFRYSKVLDYIPVIVLRRLPENAHDALGSALYSDQQQALQLRALREVERWALGQVEGESESGTTPHPNTATPL